MFAPLLCSPVALQESRAVTCEPDDTNLEISHAKAPEQFRRPSLGTHMPVDLIHTTTIVCGEETAGLVCRGFSAHRLLLLLHLLWTLLILKKDPDTCLWHRHGSA